MRILSALGLTLYLLVSTAQVPVNLAIEEFADGFDRPTTIASAGDDRLFICEKDGLIRILNSDGSIESTPFADFSSLTTTSGTSDERGLLGLAFHPDYAQNGELYVNYTRTNGDTRVARFTVSSDPNVIDPSSLEVIIDIDQPFSNHNGGCIQFGSDGYLYIGMGDGGAANDPDNYAQNMASLLGKMLRIDVDAVPTGYSVPADNPFVNTGSDTLPEIWASGLRNPWRFSFDRANGDMYIGDVGQGAIEEVDYQSVNSPGGENYGWRCYEGTDPAISGGCASADNYVFPAVEYNHNPGNNCSITGGYVYRGTEYPALNGKYIFTDYCSGRFWTAEQNDAEEWVLFESSDPQGFGWSAFGEDADGEMYVANQINGTIYTIADACADFASDFTQDGNTLTAADGDDFQWYLNGLAISGATSQTYMIEESGNYSVLIETDEGCQAFSEMQFITMTSTTAFDDIFGMSLQSNPVRTALRINWNRPSTGFIQARVTDMAGRQVILDRAEPGSDHLVIPLMDVPSGIYHAELIGPEGRSILRFVKE